MTSRTKLTLCLLFWALAGVECLPPPSPTDRASDLSGFQEFTLKLTAGAGDYFCSSLHFQQAWIHHLPDGSYTVQFAVVEQGIEGTDQCDDDYRTYQGCTWSDSETFTCPPECPVIRTLTLRPLSSSEVQRILDLFSSLTIESIHLDGTCWSLICGAIEDATWDDYTVSKDPNLGCATGDAEVLPDEEWTAIEGLLEDLRVAN